MSKPLAAAVLALTLFATVWATRAAPPPSDMTPDQRTLNLDSRLGDLDLQRQGQEFVLRHNGHDLTPNQYLTLIEAQQVRRNAGGPLYIVFNITSLSGIIWVSVGLLGQVLFTGRMIIQWLVSEKEKRSVVPPIFWHLSLAGASMLLAYFVWRKDIVGVLGQATGWFIYARNVWLIRKSKFIVTQTAPIESHTPAE